MLRTLATIMLSFGAKVWNSIRKLLWCQDLSSVTPEETWSSCNLLKNLNSYIFFFYEDVNAPNTLFAVSRLSSHTTLTSWVQCIFAFSVENIHIYTHTHAYIYMYIYIKYIIQGCSQCHSYTLHKSDMVALWAHLSVILEFSSAQEQRRLF